MSVEPTGVSNPPPDTPNKVTPLHLLNLLSLDAVSIGLIWQNVFTLQFCNRTPHLYEVAIIGGSIWLVYVADRLLDVRSMRIDQPHTMRHGFHRRYRHPIAVSWLAVFCLETILIVIYPTENQLRWGVGAVASVILYLAIVQWFKTSRYWFPKEWVAGLIFGFGVSLVSWAEVRSNAGLTLFGCWALASWLFASNCGLVAGWESRFDGAQGVSSVATRLQRFHHINRAGLTVQMICASVLLALGLLPPFIGSCLLFSSLALLLVQFRFQTMGLANPDGRSQGVLSRNSFSAVLATDLATLLIPSCMLCWWWLEKNLASLLL